MRCDVAVIGCGVVGSAIAYELACAGLSVVVIDGADPASGATGAALGVLMAVCSQQIGGAVADLRLQSLARFDPLIARLEEDLGRSLPVNRRGILLLLTDAAAAAAWAETVAARQVAGHRLEWLDPDLVRQRFPQLRPDWVGGLFSPADRQIEPVVFGHGLVEAAAQRGVQFLFQDPLARFKISNGRVVALYTPRHTIAPAAVVVAAGLGSSELGAQLGIPLPLKPVKGQALRVYCPGAHWGPVITAEDLHLVPLPDGSINIGATVEFDPPTQPPSLVGLQELIGRALRICPDLANAELRQHWSGLRPRPTGRRAPILGSSPHHANVVIATGHYRNGVLLAPITAAVVRDLILTQTSTACDLAAFAPTSSA